MVDIADIGRRHLSDALTGKLGECEVTEWRDDDGQPVKIYWRPLTGSQQRQIDAAGSEVDRVCLSVKLRALDSDARQLFAEVPLASLARDYDYDVLRAIAYIIAGNIGQDNRDEAIEKE